MRRDDRPADAVEVLIVDDQPDLRTVLRGLVNVTPGMTVVGEACTGEAALEAAADLAPRLVMMDIRMPGMGGVDGAGAWSSAMQGSWCFWSPSIGRTRTSARAVPRRS